MNGFLQEFKTKHYSRPSGELKTTPIKIFMRASEAGVGIALRGIIYTNTPKENITAEYKKGNPQKV